MKIAVTVILVSMVVVGLFSYSLARIDQLQGRVHELECRHQMFEDFSTKHEDAELARVCLGKP